MEKPWDGSATESAKKTSPGWAQEDEAKEEQESKRMAFSRAQTNEERGAR
jgi:hypothetical protein